MKLWMPLGYLFLLVAAVGVVLPLLPTTPFVLLAAGCFARSSPRLHQRLLDSELFGPVLRDWEEKKCVSLRVKVFSLTMTAGVGGGSILFFAPQGWPQLVGLALVLTGCAVILTLPQCAQAPVVQDVNKNKP